MRHDRLITLIVHEVKIGIDRAVQDTAQYVFEQFIKSEHGIWVSENATDVYWRLFDDPGNLGMIVKIFADFDWEGTAVAYKLTWSGLYSEDHK